LLSKAWAERGLVKGKIFNNMINVSYVHLTRPSIFIREKPIPWSERIFHKDYDHKGSSPPKKNLIVTHNRLGAKMN
jgi:hypothetical protein